MTGPFLPPAPRKVAPEYCDHLLTICADCEGPSEMPPAPEPAGARPREWTGVMLPNGKSGFESPTGLSRFDVIEATPAARHAGEAVALLRRIVNSGDKDSCWISASAWGDLYVEARELLERIKREMGEKNG